MLIGLRHGKILERFIRKLNAMNSKYILGIGLFVGLLGFGLVKTASAATLTVSPASSTVRAGQTFSVDILVDSQGAPIDGVDLYSLRFSPSVLQVVDDDSSAAGVQIKPGTLFSSTPINSVNNSTGAILFSQSTTGGTHYTGSGVVATIHFRAQATGSSALAFDYTSGSTSDTNVAGSGTDKLTAVTNGNFTVSAEIPPPPAGYTVDASKYPSGMFVKYASDPTVYLLSDGTKLPITDWTVYQNRVPTSRFIITIPDSVTFPSGAILGLRSGTLVKSVNSPTVYLFDGTSRLAFTNESDFLSLGYRFNQVYDINDDNLFNGYPVVNINKATFTRPSGTLFKYANNPTVYFLDQGVKKAFTSMFMFKAWYDRLDQIVTIGDNETYSDASTYILLPDGTIVHTASAPSTYYIMVNGVARTLNHDFMLSLGVLSDQVMTVSSDDLTRGGSIGTEWK